MVSASNAHPTPPTPTGDPPPATPPPPKSSGDPPATPARSYQLEEEALDYDDSPAWDAEVGPADTVELAGNQEAKEFKGKDVRGQLRSIIVKPAAHQVSFKDALVGVRTFRPRFNAAVEARGGWSVERRKVRRHVATVWDRLEPVRSVHDRLGRRGSIHDRLGSKGSIHGRVVGKPIHERLGARESATGSLSLLLKAKAENKCFNCFARDHRIADCRDPPCCILCSKSGHKARQCKNKSEARSVWREKEVRGKEKEASGRMEGIPGEPERRPSRVTACAGRTVATREAERDLELHSLVAVQLDARRCLTCDQVHCDLVRQLCIPGFALGVNMLKTATFLLRFGQPAQRNAVLGRGPLVAGSTRLHIMPWTRQFGRRLQAC